MPTKRVVIWLAFILILLVLLAGGLWYYRLRTAGGKASDPSYGLIASPLSGDVVFVGGPVYVDASFLLSHRNLASFQLYVDGAKYVLDKQTQSYASQAVPKCSSNDAKFCGPIDARMLWIPMGVGAHVLSACISGDELQGPAWNICTDPANVIVADLKTLPETGGTFLPQPGDTLESIAHKFGLPSLLVAADNPGIEPVAALSGKTPVNIPTDPSLIEPPRASGSPGSPWMLDKVTMTSDLAVDKVYCYYSLGENYWSRMPIAPQTFAYPSNDRLDLTAEFRSLVIPPGGSLALECWGWRGASLVPLGSGKTAVTPTSTIIQLRGDHFVLDATPEVIPGNFETLSKKLIIPPPVSLTQTGFLDVCIKHFPSWDIFFGPTACKVAVENGDIILIWDWLAPIFPPTDPKVSYATKIDGYHIYEVNSKGTPSLIKTVSFQDKKVLILKRSWITLGKFMVRAYVGPLESANSNLYTMGGTSGGLATVSIPAVPNSVNGISYFVDWAGKEADSCGTAGIRPEDEPYVTRTDQILVGFYHDYKDGCIEVYDYYYRSSLLFDLSAIKGPVSKAVLKYVQGKTIATDNDGFTEKLQSCAYSLNITTEISTSGITGFDPYLLLPTNGYPGAIHSVDVTQAVRDWMLGERNQGFLFIGRDESLPESIDRLDKCESLYDSFYLTVTYFEASK